MATCEKARQVAAAIERAIGVANSARFSVVLRDSRTSSDRTFCTSCNRQFTSVSYIIEHREHGRCAVSEKTVHYLAHGMTRYETGYVVDGRQVMVEIDPEDLRKYVDL
jgi:hypothetical protein